MPIDSRDKRASALNTDEGDMPAFEPDGTMTLADRMDALNTYRGILATTAAFTRKFKDWWWTT